MISSCMLDKIKADPPSEQVKNRQREEISPFSNASPLLFPKRFVDQSPISIININNLDLLYT